MSTAHSGKICGMKVRYPDGVGCSLVYKISDKEEDDESGLAFDFPVESLDDVAIVTRKLQIIEPTDFVPDPKYEAYEEKIKILKEKWWWKLHKSVEDLGIHFTPFDWNFRTLFVTRPIGTKSDVLVYKMCCGVHIGPLLITW